MKTTTTMLRALLAFLLIVSAPSVSSCDKNGGETEKPEQEKPEKPDPPQEEPQVMDPSKIEDYNKYYCPATYNEGFEKGPKEMLRKDARWSWWRMKQSEHFFVFWEPGFGDDPNSSSLPANLRVDIDDLLAKAEQFYTTNVEKLGMAVTGQGKSRLDSYKMQIYLLYQTEWLATGSGYDNMIGALWVNPSTCQPVGSVIGHEIGHSFQYQVSADLLMNKVGSITDFGATVGFRYGFDLDGSGGCAFWEQCAQWQSFQDFPEEAFSQDYHVQEWLAHHHRGFLHEWYRYASYWFPYWYTQEHGIGTHARIWRESVFPEDALQTYMRLYFDGDTEKFYDEYFSYAQHCAAYDFDAVHKYVTESALHYTTSMFRNSDGRYQVSYGNCPGTTGFNLVPLNVAAGETVKVEFNGLEPGSALVAEDPGKIIDGDGNVQGTMTTYNKQSNKESGYRFGFVSIDYDGVSHYGDMYSGTSGTAEYDVPENAQRLYFVVVGAPKRYRSQAWDDNGKNDEQWPYEISIENTDLLGNVTIPDGEPEDVALSHELSLDSSRDIYELGSMNLLDNGDMIAIAKAFRLQPSAISSVTLSKVGTSGPADGQVAVGLTQSDGSISYNYTANGTGFWCKANGDAGYWQDGVPVYFEYDPASFRMAYGHRYGVTAPGKEYVIKPTMVYKKDGKVYKAVITLKFKF